jgi:hypothetical protein
MALTIVYRPGDQPHAAVMTMISSRENVSMVVDELEKRGFVVVKITIRSSASRAPHHDDP